MGAHLVDRLAESHELITVTHRSEVEGTIRADLGDINTVERLVQTGARTVIHAACTIAKPSVNLAMLRTVLEVCKRTGAQLIHCSTTQVNWKNLNRYAEGRLHEETILSGSGVPFVCLRPCAPYGPSPKAWIPRHTESFRRLANAIQTWPALPVIGSGHQLRQPLHAHDWCDVVSGFLGRELGNSTFDVGGPRAYSFNRIADILGRHMGRYVKTIHIPTRVAQIAAYAVPGMTSDMVSTFECDDVVDLAPLQLEINKHQWITFEEGAADLVGQWRLDRSIG